MLINSTHQPRLGQPSLPRQSRIRLWTARVNGPEKATNPVVVSLTQFTLNNPWDVIAIRRRAKQLTAGWYGLPGAISVWLWADFATLRRGAVAVGAVSVWTDESQLRRWVGLPLHRETMRRYHGRGALQSALWESNDTNLRTIRQAAERRLDTQNFT